MQIKMYVKEDGIVVFECQGVLKEPLEKIILNRDTRLFSLVFKDSGEEVELDCPLDEEAWGAMGNHDYCIMGFCDGQEVLGATMLRIEGVQSL